MKRKQMIAGILAAVTLVSGMAAPSFAAQSRFTDVRDDAWYAPAVRAVSGHGMMTGMGDNRFAPSAVLTRAELAQILYNHAGKPEVGGSSAFIDVAGDAWYYNAVRWAARNAIVYGVGDNRFQPNDSVTREQLAAFLYRYYAKTGNSPSVDMQTLKGFRDGDAVASWAKTSMAWAVTNKIMSGTDDKKLLPTSTATRAQAAQMLNGYLELTGDTHNYVLTNDTGGRKAYTCTICGHVKTQASSPISNVRAGLYIVPGTYDMLYVEKNGESITFTAWWYHSADISDATATLHGNTAAFDWIGDETGQSAAGSIQFDGTKATLYLTEACYPLTFHEKTEYTWLRDSMWKLSDEQLREIGKGLGVPAGLAVAYEQGESYYWDAGQRYITYVRIFYQNKVVAAASVDTFSGEFIRDILMYTA